VFLAGFRPSKECPASIVSSSAGVRVCPFGDSAGCLSAGSARLGPGRNRSSVASGRPRSRGRLARRAQPSPRFVFYSAVRLAGFRFSSPPSSAQTDRPLLLLRLRAPTALTGESEKRATKISSCPPSSAAGGGADAIAAAARGID